MSDSLVFWEWITILFFPSQKASDLIIKIHCFHEHVFHCFSPFYPLLCPRANPSHFSSLPKIYIFHSFLTVFPLFMPWSKSLPLLFAPSLFKKEWQEGLALWKEQIAISLICSQNTSDSLKKPKSEVPTLTLSVKICWI